MTTHSNSNSGMDPDQLNRLVSDICKSWQTKETVNEVLAMGAKINYITQERLAPWIAACQASPSLVPTKDEFFAKIHNAFLDTLVQHRIGRDELMFLLAFNSTKILVDQLWPL